jgi:hypothetical protein
MLKFRMSKYIGSNTMMICFFQCLLHGGICSVSLNILLSDVASFADVGRCSIRVGLGSPGGGLVVLSNVLVRRPLLELSWPKRRQR